MTEYDGLWKEVLGSYFEAFLSFFFSQEAALIDWSRGAESLAEELQQVAPESAVGRQVVDKLVKVLTLEGQDLWLLIHVEVQSQRDHDFANRMFLYNTRLIQLYNCRVFSCAVLGDEEATWRPDHWRQEFGRCWTDFGFPIVKLTDFRSRIGELESDASPFARVVLAHLKTQDTRRDPESRLAWKVRLITALYDRMDREGLLRLFRFTDWIMDLPAAFAKRFWKTIKEFEKSKNMPFMTTPERLGRAEGLREGLMKGREQGREEGREEGRRHGLLTALEIAVKTRFGTSGDAVLEAMRHVERAEALESLLAHSGDTLIELESAVRGILAEE